MARLTATVIPLAFLTRAIDADVHLLVGTIHDANLNIRCAWPLDNHGLHSPLHLLSLHVMGLSIKHVLTHSLVVNLMLSIRLIISM